MWSAWYQSTRKDYAGAIATLEAGRRRVGASAPFLPNLVSMARLAGDNALAERYTEECAAEDRKGGSGALKTMFDSRPALTGLHAECVRRLGYTPNPAQQGGVVQSLQSPLAAPTALGSKFQSLLRKR